MSESNVEVRRIRRLLKTTVELAEQASLTGSLQKGVKNSVYQFNTILTHLEQAGVIPAGFFRPMDEDATFDEVGVASAQLASFLGDDDEEAERGTTYQGPKYNIINNNNNNGREGRDRRPRDAAEEHEILESIVGAEDPTIEAR
jgi:hypothetical protein